FLLIETFSQPFFLLVFYVKIRANFIAKQKKKKKGYRNAVAAKNMLKSSKICEKLVFKIINKRSRKYKLKIIIFFKEIALKKQ
ncbi:hypothetical protein PT310_00965, partial [Metamycoplasma hyosynoviae]|uniref:hypothetical protein n=1 Tax=Metamycoplasma hyosynoviae TaxID=29559 RepID=UPI0023624054